MRKSGRSALILLAITISLASFAATAEQARADDKETCAICHTDTEAMDELTEALIANQEEPEESEMQEGHGYLLKQAPFDLYEKMLVSPDFLNTVHGKISCSTCHKGNPRAEDTAEAHQGLVKDPSMDNLEAACGQCHYKIVNSGRKSLHARPNVLFATLKERSAPDEWQKIHDQAMAAQCLTCHQSSCGSCHVSRPNAIGGGLAAGHNFNKKPDFTYQCASCHTVPVADDYTGSNSMGDVHYRNGRMVCVDCHKAEEMHAAGDQLQSRFHLQEMPKCQDCHQNLEQGNIRHHGIHNARVACTVCHSQAYISCASCHLGRDQDGLPFTQSEKGIKGFKVGMNADQSIPGRNQEYVLVRQVPVQPDSFKNYTGSEFSHFDSLPTYKRTTPHNIQRKTWQSAHCNNCHGQKDLFLTGDDLDPALVAANKHVIVPESRIPKRINTLTPLVLPKITVDNSVRVDAKWLFDHRRDNDLIILDVRLKSQYEEGHIPGAIHYCACYVRTNNVAKPPFMMLPPAELAKNFGEKIGLTPEKRVILYNDGKATMGNMFLALELIGHEKIAFLDGNITSWQKAGFPIEIGENPQVAPTTYTARPKDLLADSDYIRRQIEKGNLVVLDARNVSQHVGDTKQANALYAGRIPGSSNLPLQTLLDDEGALKPVEEISWILSNHHIHPHMEATIVTSCNTNALASELYVILRYLGYKNVKVHDGSWIEWTMQKK